uniref:LIM zinc-binding domain-containing protein n=1 Tax=Strongyloides venezuelensis TaxID=75913 RepID=A0A0K0EY74_STRVS
MGYIVKTKSEVVKWNKNFDSNNDNRNNSNHNVRRINIVRNDNNNNATSNSNVNTITYDGGIKNIHEYDEFEKKTTLVDGDKTCDNLISKKSAFIPIKREGLFRGYFSNVNGSSNSNITQSSFSSYDDMKKDEFKKDSYINDTDNNIKISIRDNNDNNITRPSIVNGNDVKSYEYKNSKSFSSDNKRYAKSENCITKYYQEVDDYNRNGVGDLNNMSIAVDSRRSMSRASNISDIPSQHVDAIHSTLAVLKEDVEKTTELIRRKQQEQLNEQKMFNANMEVNGRISMIADDDWLSTRLKSISRDDMRKELDKIKSNQHQNVVGDTLAALVYDVEATTEVLRRAGQKKPKKTRVISEEVEYRLKLSPAPENDDSYDPKPKKREYPDYNDTMTMETIKNDYGVEITEDSISQRHQRARSQTPRRTIAIDSTGPPAPIAICAYCSEEIDGPILTALAPNADRAQKFHPYHFMCIYCQKALSLRGTYREHEKKPYCHECFYKLYNGLQYCPDLNQANIEKLI